MSALGAARTGDQIGHGIGMLGMLAGAVGGALVGMAIVAGTVATGGVLAGVITATIIAGSVAGGATATHQIIKGVAGVSRLPDPPTGFLAHGSHSVMINSLPAARATGDGSYACTGGVGMYWNHPVLPIMGILPSGILVAEGSKTVLFNNLPAARVGSVLTCGAKIVSGSPKVFIGGATVRTEFVWDGVGWLETGFLGLGMVALGGGAVLAVVASVVTVSLLPVAVFGAATWGSYKALEGLGQVGDMIGPGCKDLFQGVAGMGLLLAGPAIAKRMKPASSKSSSEEASTPQQKASTTGKTDNSDEMPTLSLDREPDAPYSEPVAKSTVQETVPDEVFPILMPDAPEGPPVMAQISPDETIIVGHGGYRRGDGMVVIPEGTWLLLYVRFGAEISTDYANHLANGGAYRVGEHYLLLLKPGQKSPNLTLGYDSSPSPIRPGPIIRKPTLLGDDGKPLIMLLRDILKPNMGKCHWLACVSCEDAHPFSRQIHSLKWGVVPKDANSHIPNEGDTLLIPEVKITPEDYTKSNGLAMIFKMALKNKLFGNMNSPVEPYQPKIDFPDEVKITPEDYGDPKDLGIAFKNALKKLLDNINSPVEPYQPKIDPPDAPIDPITKPESSE